MFIPSSELGRVAELYDQGLYLQAYRVAQSTAPLNEWEGTEARLLAGRLASNLGALELGRTHHIRAWRHDRSHREACYFYARVINEFRGPLAALKFMRQCGELSGAPPQSQAEWLSLEAYLLGLLRDFDAAEDRLMRAEKLDPASAWVSVERAALLELEDRYEESLAASRRALSLHPWYRPAVLSAAHTLSLLGRDAEALALLKEAAEKIESNAVLAQLAGLQFELGHYTEAQESLEQFAKLSPLIEPDVSRWLNSFRSDVAYHCGEIEKATLYAEASDAPFHQRLVERLRQAPVESRRVLLPVPFTRQHHMTCAPATIATISRYWNKPADHLSLVEAICYDGTPAYSERIWAEQHGWTVREFCVNWEDAVALLDRGVAFTLTTVEPANAHMQAIIGYDSRRRTLLARDPYVRSLSEFAADEMIENYRSTGPRGMALVPSEKALVLDGLELKEAELYDQLFQVQCALMRHERATALAVLQAMSGAAEGHRLTLQAQLALAAYDDDQTKLLSCYERLLELFPDDINLKLNKLACLRTLARRSERLDLLKAICAEKDSHPLFWQEYAQELSSNAQQHPAALGLLRRAFRAQPLEARNFFLQANILWAHHRFDEALELYRFAACLKDTDEQFAHSYFIASRHFHQTETALRFLESRFQRFGRRSSLPVRTLFWAYEQLDRMSEAFATLEAGLALRPDDMDLVLFAAEAHARHGKYDQAAELLSRAESISHSTLWLRTAAAIASYRGDLAAALSFGRRILEIEPLAIDTHRQVAQLLAETESREAAIAHLREVSARFPYNYALHQILVEWLRDDPPAAEAALRHLIEIDPMDGWARRELALALCKQRRFDQAQAEAWQAYQLEPDSFFSFNVLGKVYAEAGEIEAAKASYREAIRLSADNEYAIGELVALATSRAERRAVLQFIKEELAQQVTFGDGILAYRDHAKDTLEAEELLTTLREALKARPDLWQAWSAVIWQLVDMQQLDEALQLAEQATAAFPLIPRLWYDLSLVHQAQLNRRGEIAALQEALKINPGWGIAARQLAEAHQKEGELDKARTILEQATAYAPLDPYNHGCLADVLWKLGEKEQALAQLQRVLALEPDYGWGWNVLREWSKQLNRPEVATNFARDLTTQRAGEARSWLILARMLTDPQDLPERLAAIDHALALSPRSVEAHTLRVQLLAEAKRFDEAQAACHPPVFGDELPLDLRSSEVGVIAQRGKLREAARKMRALLDDEPNYYAGWSQLADWCRALEWTRDYLEAARAMAQLAPNYYLALGYLGDALMLNGYRQEAKEALRRAMILEPGYEYASATLFNLRMEDGELEQAHEVLELLRKHVGSETTSLCEVKLAARMRHREAAEESFRQLCLSSTQARNLFDEAVSAMAEANWNEIVDRVLDETLALPAANPLVGAMWAERLTARRGFRRCRKRLETRPEKGELWHEASIAYLDALAKAQKRRLALHFIWQHQHQLRSKTFTWGQVGYVLLSLEEIEATIKWLADWPNRLDAAPWMLWNLALALRLANREQEAEAVSLHALRLSPDSFTDAHAALLALDGALSCQVAAAAERLAGLNASTLREWDRFVYELASELLDFHRALDERKARLSSAINHLIWLGENKPFFWGSNMLTRLHRRAVYHIALSHGNIFITLGATLRLAMLYLMMVLASILRPSLGR